jgi:hypothetical protein
MLNPTLLAEEYKTCSEPLAPEFHDFWQDDKPEHACGSSPNLPFPVGPAGQNTPSEWQGVLSTLGGNF